MTISHVGCERGKGKTKSPCRLMSQNIRAIPVTKQPRSIFLKRSCQESAKSIATAVPAADRLSTSDQKDKLSM